MMRVMVNQARVPIGRFGLTGLFIGLSYILLLSTHAKAQFVVFNNGAAVTVTEGCIASILVGDLDNNAGSIDNLGRLTVDGDLTNDEVLTGGGGSSGIFNVSGDWENNDVFIADQSLVNLIGGNQSITGSSLSSFYNLNLLAAGIKSLELNAEITGDLELNNSELATQGNTLIVLNTASDAITATTGFISSTGNGRVSWNINSTDTYVFPLGSSTGTLRVRPLAITPSISSANTFAVRMANVNATIEGYDVNSIHPDLCTVNNQFYHLIDHISGSDSVDIDQYFDPNEDGEWYAGAHWQNMPQWEDMENEIIGSSGIYTTITTGNWTDFGQAAFILANAIPNVSFAAIADLCVEGAPITLGAMPIGGSFMGTGVGNGVFDPNNAGVGLHTITYTYTDLLGCENSAETTVDVSETPLVEITSSNNGSLELCDGDTLDLIATTGFATYTWNPSGQTEQISIWIGGNYSVTVTDVNGCEGTSSVASVTIAPAPSPVATPLGPTSFCEGESLILSTVANMSEYLWENTGSLTPTTIVTESGDYFVTVINQLGCEGSSNIITVDVTPPVVSIILENGNTLTADPPGSSYQWFLNGNPIPGATGISHVAVENGNYTVEYMASNGCPAISYILEFTLSTGIVENSVFNMLDLYPNPGKGNITIRGILSSMEDVTIELTNMLGQSLQPAIRINGTNDFTQPMDISDYANGVYFIRVQAADSNVTIRYIKS